VKLQLKRSNVLDGGKAKEPTPPYVEYGELCVNYNTSDPALFIKDSNDNIIRIAGKNSVGSGSNPSGPINPNTGNNIGDVFFNTGDLILYYWDGTEWVPIANQKNAADIYVGTFAEVDVEIPVAERRNGLLLWETEEGNLFLWYIDADTAQWVVAVPGGGSGGGGGSSNVTVLDVAPNNPKQGDLWYCTLDGRLYIYYEDVNTSQWVDASPDNLSDGFWERDGTTLKPVVAGDGISAAAGMFSGSVTAGPYDRTSTTTAGCQVGAGGTFSSQRIEANASTGVAFQAFSGTDQTVSIMNDGSTTFFHDTYDTGSASGYGVRIYAGGNAGTERGSIQLQSTSTSTETARVLFVRRGTGITWSVTAGGTIGTRGLIIETEPDDPSNYISQMVEGEEEQIYTGPTLDVKDRLLNALARIEALEAEVQALKGGN
jgi:hypothetical protein